MNLRLAARIVGATPVLPGRSRHAEIMAYLQRHVRHDTQWVALDDTPEQFPRGCPYLIRCDPRSGLTESVARELARLTGARCGRSAHMLDCSPLLAWMFYAGRCPGCGARVVPPLATLPELLAIGATAAVLLRFGPSAAGGGALLFAWGLILLGLLSWLHALMPNVLTYGLLWAGLALNLGGTYVPLDQAVAGAVSGYLVPWALNRAVRLIRGRDLLGYGAMKTLAAVGAWLGSAASLVVFVGALSLKLAGLVLNDKAASLEPRSARSDRRLRSARSPG